MGKKIDKPHGTIWIGSSDASPQKSPAEGLAGLPAETARSVKVFMYAWAYHPDIAERLMAQLKKDALIAGAPLSWDLTDPAFLEAVTRFATRFDEDHLDKTQRLEPERTITNDAVAATVQEFEILQSTVVTDDVNRKFIEDIVQAYTRAYPREQQEEAREALERSPVLTDALGEAVKASNTLPETAEGVIRILENTRGIDRDKLRFAVEETIVLRRYQGPVVGALVAKDAALVREASWRNGDASTTHAVRKDQIITGNRTSAAILEEQTERVKEMAARINAMNPDVSISDVDPRDVIARPGGPYHRALGRLSARDQLRAFHGMVEHESERVGSAFARSSLTSHIQTNLNNAIQGDPGAGASSLVGIRDTAGRVATALFGSGNRQEVRAGLQTFAQMQHVNSLLPNTRKLVQNRTMSQLFGRGARSDAVQLHIAALLSPFSDQGPAAGLLYKKAIRKTTSTVATTATAAGTTTGTAAAGAAQVGFIQRMLMFFRSGRTATSAGTAVVSAAKAAGTAASVAKGAAAGSGGGPLGAVGGALIGLALGAGDKVVQWFNQGAMVQIRAGYQAIIGGVGFSDFKSQQKFADTVVLVAIGTVLLLGGPLFFLLNTFQTGEANRQVALAESLAELETLTPEDYIDFSALGPFECLVYEAGRPAPSGTQANNPASLRLTPAQQARIESAARSTPQLSLLSCPLQCPSRTIGITAFPNDHRSGYWGWAPSTQQGHVFFYPAAFRTDDKSLARLIAHELGHEIQYFRPEIYSEFMYGSTSGPQAYCGPIGTYQAGAEVSSETFAEVVALYIMGDSRVRGYCGGRAFNLMQRIFSC